MFGAPIYLVKFVNAGPWFDNYTCAKGKWYMNVKIALQRYSLYSKFCFKFVKMRRKFPRVTIDVTCIYVYAAAGEMGYSPRISPPVRDRPYRVSPLQDPPYRSAEQSISSRYV